MTRTQHARRGRPCPLCGSSGTREASNYGHPTRDGRAFCMSCNRFVIIPEWNDTPKGPVVNTQQARQFARRQLATPSRGMKRPPQFATVERHENANEREREGRDGRVRVSRSVVVVWIVRDQFGEVVDEFTTQRAAIAAAHAVGPALVARAYRRSDGTYEAAVLRCITPPNVFDVIYNSLDCETAAEAIAEAQQWIADHATAKRKGTT